jgi:hypothetical protein
MAMQVDVVITFRETGEDGVRKESSYRVEDARIIDGAFFLKDGATTMGWPLDLIHKVHTKTVEVP